jgi:hypothetical protein
MYNVDPHTFLFLHEQNREREQMQRALERAARTGERRPGIVRGGISSFARFVRRSSSGAGYANRGGTRGAAGSAA